MTAEIRAIVETASAMFAIDRALILIDATARLDAAIAALHPPQQEANPYANAAFGAMNSALDNLAYQQMFQRHAMANQPTWQYGGFGGALGWWP